MPLSLNSKLKEFKLVRTVSTLKGTLGLLYHDTDFVCYTLELPWNSNERRVSCIPALYYRCEIWNSPKFGFTFEVMGVPNRSKILIHKGNWLTDINGCVLVGLQQSILDNSNARYSVFKSTDAFNKIKGILDKDIAFNLNITNL